MRIAATTAQRNDRGRRGLEFPGYSIICEIGRGGMATVFRARQVMLDREVALKVLSPNLAADSANAQRFLQEARMLASLEHPNVVPVYDVGVTPDGSHYFSMQLLEHGDFKERLQRGVSEAELVRVLTAVADALTYAHARGYVHRDVTPSNILFDADDKPRLTDFGIARAMAASSRITASGLSVGTSHYMSPEQARGGEVDPRSDIYSLGVLCYESLTGHPPFRGEDSFAVAYAHVYEPVPPLPAKLAKWQPLVDRCLAKNPADRFQDCVSFTAALRRIVFPGVASETIAPARDETPTTPRGRRPEAAAPAPVAAVAAVADAMPTDEAAHRWLGPLLGLVGLLAVIAVVAAWQAWRHIPSAPTLVTAPLAQEPAAQAGATTPASGDGNEDESTGEIASATGASGTAESGDQAALQTVVDPVKVLLELAQADIAARRYSAPPGNNALERYRLVQRFEPKNAEARAGIERVVSNYLRLADGYADDDDPSMWSGYLQRAEELAGQYTIEAVTRGVAERRQARIARIVKDAEAATAAWDRERAVLLYQRAVALDPGAEAVKKALARAERIGRDGFVFQDRVDGRNGPEMIVVNGLGFSRAPITVGEFRHYWDADGARRFGQALPTCRDRDAVFGGLRRRSFLDPGFKQGDDHPVVCISAAMADDYVRWLSRVSGKAYRLPTKVELHAAGVGATRDCALGNIRDAAFRELWGGRGDTATCNDGHASTAPVATFKPAANGLRDALGNVREWSDDCVGSGCRERLAIGSSWASPIGEEVDRSFPADTGFNTIGFRVVRAIH